MCQLCLAFPFGTCVLGVSALRVVQVEIWTGCRRTRVPYAFSILDFLAVDHLGWKANTTLSCYYVIKILLSATIELLKQLQLTSAANEWGSAFLCADEMLFSDFNINMQWSLIALQEAWIWILPLLLNVDILWLFIWSSAAVIVWLAYYRQFLLPVTPLSHFQKLHHVNNFAYSGILLWSSVGTLKMLQSSLCTGVTCT